MKTQLANLWEKVHTSYWFVPTLMVGLAVILAFAMIWVDITYVQGKGLPTYLGFPLLYSGGMEGARELLSTIAASVITIAGVTFSITIVALSMAGSQFGPMVLRNYMRSTGSQMVMGIFAGTFIYCLLILRAIEGNSEEGFELQASVTGAVILALMSIYAFIYFIHHEAESIKAGSVIQAAYEELRHGIDHLYPQDMGEGQDPQANDPDEETVLAAYEDRQPMTVHVERAGYLQAVNGERLMTLAQKHDILFHLCYKPGDFLMPDSPLVRCYGGQPLGEEQQRQIKGAFLIGSKRTPEQDAEFTINELVQITLRALSPSLNDPQTAMLCIDHLGASLSILSRRRFPSRYRYDSRQQLRVIARVSTFTDFAMAAFHQIGYNCGPQETVRRHLVSVLKSIASHTECESRRQVIRRLIGEVQPHNGQGNSDPVRERL